MCSYDNEGSIYNQGSGDGGGGGSGWLNITSDCTIGINPNSIVDNGVCVLYNESSGLLKFDLKTKSTSFSGNSWNSALIIPNYIKFNAKQYAYILPRASQDYQYNIPSDGSDGRSLMGICTNNFDSYYASEKNDFSTNELKYILSTILSSGFILSGIFAVDIQS